MKKKFNYEEYIRLLSMLADASFESTKEAFFKNNFSTEDSFLKVMNLSSIYIFADLSHHWLGLDKDTVQKDLAEQFYVKYPESFFLHLNKIIKSPDTMIKNIHDFLTEILLEEYDAASRFEAVCFIHTELTPALNCFSAMLRSTKRKGEYFKVNFPKYAFLVKRQNKNLMKPE